MADESGIRTVLADKDSTSPRALSKALVILAVLTASTGCVYFNALYNANKIFKQGVKEIEQGRPGSGEDRDEALCHVRDGIVIIPRAQEVPAGTEIVV